jgi:adiponectin receptor
MSTSKVRKRWMPSDNRGNVEMPTSRPEAGAITVGLNNAPEWQRDNKYIVRGYRPRNTGYLDVVKSLTFLHNETCNIYTHLIGTLLLPFLAASFLQVLSEPQFSNVSGKDYIVLGIFFWSAECCLVFSTAYHLVGCYSYDVEQFWLRMDLLGIVAVIIGTSIPEIYYAFACEPSLQKLHCTVVRHICSPR